MMIIGLGNEFRHDDAVGLIVARRLRDKGIPAEEHEGDLAALMDRWKHAEALIVIDAVQSGAAPGTLHRKDVSTSPLERELFKSSTHALGLADAIELSRVLATLPPRVSVFGVETRDLTAGVGLSFEIERVLPMLVQELEELIRQHT